MSIYHKVKGDDSATVACLLKTLSEVSVISTAGQGGGEGS